MTSVYLSVMKPFIKGLSADIFEKFIAKKKVREPTKTLSFLIKTKTELYFG